MITVAQTAETIASLCGRPDLQPVYVDPRPGDVLALQADTRRAEELLGFRPEIDFENGLRRYISWFRAHHNDVSALLEDDVRNW
jgi:nucleoside-diphosphate-sugar epimerase